RRVLFRSKRTNRRMSSSSSAGNSCSAALAMARLLIRLSSSFARLASSASSCALYNTAWSPPTRSSKSSISASVMSVPATVAKAGSVSALTADVGVSGPVQAANKRKPRPPSARDTGTLHPFWNIFMKLRLFLCHRLQQSLHLFVFRQLAQLETNIAFHLLKGHGDDLGILQLFHNVVTKGG